VSERTTKLVGIYTSPRKGGNSDTLLDAALEGAAEAGAEIQRLHVRDLDFVPCQNCGSCSSKGTCRITDDMTVIYDALDNSDVIVLASPIYFCSLCAQAKTMIDRCQPYWARKYVLKQEPPKAGRVGGFVSCGGFKDDRFLACTEQIIRSWYFILDIDYRGCLFVPGLDARGDAARHPAAVKDAFEYGTKLIAEGSGRS